MSRKVDDWKFARIVELRQQYGLTVAIIAERMGISERTVRIYMRAARLNEKPYHKDDPHV